MNFPAKMPQKIGENRDLKFSFRKTAAAAITFVCDRISIVVVAAGFFQATAFSHLLDFVVSSDGSSGRGK